MYFSNFNASILFFEMVDLLLLAVTFLVKVFNNSVFFSALAFDLGKLRNCLLLPRIKTCIVIPDLSKVLLQLSDFRVFFLM